MLTKTETILKSNLKKLREKQGLTACALSSRVGIDHSFYYRIENPERHCRFNFDLLEKIATYYKLEVYDLLKEDLLE